MGNQLLHFRLKTERRKKRLQKQDLDKQILRLSKERRLLWNSDDLVKVIPLDQPYQRGYVRMFALKPEIEKSSQAGFYQQILNRINDVQYHYDASFKKTKRKKNRHLYNYDMPALRTIDRSSWEINKMEFTSQQKECFKSIVYFDDHRYQLTCKYEFLYPELFKIVVQPYMVTSVKERDIEMQKRINYIDDYLEKTGLEYRLTRLQGGYYWSKRDWDNPKYANLLKNKPSYKGIINKELLLMYD